MDSDDRQVSYVLGPENLQWGGQGLHETSTSALEPCAKCADDYLTDTGKVNYSWATLWIPKGTNLSYLVSAKH